MYVINFVVGYVVVLLQILLQKLGCHCYIFQIIIYYGEWQINAKNKK